MAFEKSYPNRKDQRRSYKGSARGDRSCRPGGSCSWCRDNCLHNRRKVELESRMVMKEGA